MQFSVLPPASMGNAKQITLPNVSEAFMKAADVILVLDDGAAVLCHSQILSLHSAVLCNMLSDLAEHEGKVRIPLPGFTEAQCTALLKYLYGVGLTTRGAAFGTNEPADRDAATAVARFAHTYDAPHVLRHVEAYLTGFMRSFKNSGRITPVKAGTSGSGGPTCTYAEFVNWAVMADKFDLPELRGHCERALVLSWEVLQDRPHLLEKLSCSVLQRVAKGLNKAVLAAEKSHPKLAPEYPDAKEMAAWGQHK